MYEKNELIILKKLKQIDDIKIEKINLGLGVESEIIIKVLKKENYSKWCYFNKKIKAIKGMDVVEKFPLIQFTFNSNITPYENLLNLFLENLNKKYYLINEPKIDAMSIILKVTNCCNLDCKYCYDKPFRDALGHVGIIKFETLDKMISLASKYAKTVYIMWHGGEPTLAGIDFYKKFYKEIIPKYPYCEIIPHLQTNGTLIDKNWIDFISEYNMPASSSFNYLAEEQRRTKKDNKFVKNDENIYSVLKNVELGRKNGIVIGLIDVLTKDSHPYVKKIYEFYRDNGYNCALNEVFKSGEATNYDYLFYTKKEQEKYLKTTTDFFSYWCKDKSAISERYASNYISTLLTGVSPVCEHRNVCIYTYVGLNPNGDIYPCDRALSDKYRIGNVFEFNSMEEIYNTEKYQNYANERAWKIEKVCGNCNIKNYCRGGCPMQDIDEHMDASIPNTYACKIRHLNILAAYRALQTIDDIDECNNILKNLILTKNAVLPSEIPELLKYLGVYEHFKDIDFVNKNGGFESDAFKLFKILNYPIKEDYIVPFDMDDYNETERNYNVTILPIDNRFKNIKDKLQKMGKSTLEKLLLEKKEEKSC